MLEDLISKPTFHGAQTKRETARKRDREREREEKITLHPPRR